VAFSAGAGLAIAAWQERAWIPMLALLATCALAVVAYRHARAVFWWMLLLAPLFQLYTDVQSPRGIVFTVLSRILPVFLAAILVLQSLRRQGKRRPRSPVLWALLAFAAVSIISAATNSALGFKKWTLIYDQQLLPIANFVLALTLIKSRADLKMLLRVLAIVAIYVSALTLFELFTGSKLFMPSEWLAGNEVLHIQRPSGPFDPFVGGTVLVMLAVLSMHGYSNSTAAQGRVLFLIATILSVMGALATETRTVWIALLISFSAYLGYQPRKVLKAAVIGLVAVGIVLLTMGERIAESTFFSERVTNLGNIIGRYRLLVIAGRMFAERPVWGWGYGGYRLVIDQFYGGFESLHNTLIAIAVNLGLVGALVTCLIGVTIARQVVFAMRTLPAAGLVSKKLVVALASAMLAYLVLSFSSDLTVSYLYLHQLLWIVVGVLVSCPHLPGELAVEGRSLNCPSAREHGHGDK
jgi:O-antigen ligase